MNSSSAYIIQAQQLSKQIRSNDSVIDILMEINLAIKPAESVAILGVSGSGKSTLLGLLAGLDRPTTGRVLLQDHDLSTLSEDERAKLRLELVGFIFQSFFLFSHLTALENVMLPLELNNKVDAKLQATELLAKVGLAKRLQHYPHQLSGGEQQRVAIARAFVTRPAILFADEITGSLDKKTGTVISELLFQLNSEHKTTLILVTHDEQLAKRCQRCLQLEEGRLA